MIKKAYVELIELLEANKNRKVSTILPELIELVSAKGQSKAFHKDEAGELIAVFCYYHKKWELVSEVEYGKKASTAHGLNTMCKAGVSEWSKQQRKAKQAKETLLAAVANEEVAATELSERLAEIELDRGAVVDNEQGFDTLEEAIDFNNGVS